MRSSRVPSITTKQRTIPRPCEFLSHFWHDIACFVNFGIIEGKLD